MVALRQVLEQAWQLGLMTAEDRDRAKKLPTSKGTRLPAGQHLPIERVGALLAECEIVNRPPGQSGFVVLARRWIVERTLSGVMRAHRNCRDYERLPAHSEAHITWAAITLMSRPRLAGLAAIAEGTVPWYRPVTVLTRANPRPEQVSELAARLARPVPDMRIKEGRPGGSRDR